MSVPAAAPVAAASASVLPSPPVLLSAPALALSRLGQSLPAQTEPAAGGPVAFVGTLVVSWAFFAFTAQVAATFLLGDVPWRRAAVVGVVPAVTVGALISYPPAVILVIALAADLVAIQIVYRLRYRTAALVALMHVVAAISLGVPLVYLLYTLGTAPG